MAGLRGNQAWWMAQKQASKGTAATVAVPAAAVPGAYKNAFSGGNIGFVRETDRLSETDAARDQGNLYVTTSGVEGSPEMYVRDAGIGQMLHAVLGSDAPTGTTPNFTHVLTPANTLPYYTFWRSVSDTLWEQYRDCKVSSMTLSAEAGGAMTCALGVQGLQGTRLTADPSVTPAIAMESSKSTQPVYTFNDAAVTLSTGSGGGVTALVRSFELTIENNVTRQQTDDVIPYDAVEGVREITLGFDLIFETLDEYLKFHTGTASGTAISSSVFVTDALFTFSKGANNQVSFNLPSIAYEEFPVEPDPGGDPIVSSVRAVAQRPSSGSILTATVKNQVAVY